MGSNALAAATGDVGRIRLEDCLTNGLAKSVAVQNSARDEQIAETRIDQVRADLFPHLGVGGTYRMSDEGIPMFSESGLPVDSSEQTTDGGVEATQLLYNGGQVRAALDAARSYRDYRRQGSELARRELVRNIRLAFNELLMVRERLAVEQESHAQLSRFAEQVEQKFAQQTVSRFDLLSARVRLANHRPILIQAQNHVELAKEALRKVAYLPAGDFGVDGALEYEAVSVESTEAIRKGQERRLEIRQQESYVKLLRAGRRSVESAYWPEIRAFGSYNGSDPDNYHPEDPGWGWHWAAGVRAQWSWLDGGLRRAKVRENVEELSKAEADLGELMRSIEWEITRACVTMRNAEEALVGAKENVALAEEALQIARSRYDQGLATYLEFMESNVALSASKLVYFAALREHMDATIHLRHACGEPDPILETIETNAKAGAKP
jgi:outer membrane protein TolC